MIYYEDEKVTLIHGDCRDHWIECDAVVTDPPYQRTQLEWDTEVRGWLECILADQMWLFSPLRFFLNNRLPWHLAEDVIWEKQNGSGMANDRFRRVHETITHWYRGKWGELYHKTPRDVVDVQRALRWKERPDQWGGQKRVQTEDGGKRIMRSVLKIRNLHGRAVHPTQKPVELLKPLVESITRDTVYDPFAGSGSTLIAAKALGLKAVGVQAIVAKGFARIFYRAAINQGLLLVECAEAIDAYKDGDEVSLDPQAGQIKIGGKVLNFPKLPPEILAIREAGGLLPYTRAALKKR